MSRQTLEERTDALESILDDLRTLAEEASGAQSESERQILHQILRVASDGLRAGARVLEIEAPDSARVESEDRLDAEVLADLSEAEQRLLRAVNETRDLVTVGRKSRLEVSSWTVEESHSGFGWVAKRKIAEMPNDSDRVRFRVVTTVFAGGLGGLASGVFRANRGLALRLSSDKFMGQDA